MAATAVTIPDGAKYHPILLSFPAMSDEEGQALLESIKSTGVQESVLLWTDPDGQAWVVDGRHRLEKYRELAERSLLPDGHEELPVQELICSEAEMLEIVMDRNFTRRHMGAGQRACAAVLTEKVRNKSLGISKGEQKSQEGDRATAQALKANVNRQYIFDARYCFSNGKAVFNRVLAGELSMHEGLRAIRAALRAAKDADGAGGDDGSNGDGSHGEDNGQKDAGAEVVILDGLGNEISDPALQPIFAARQTFQDALSLLRQAGAAMNGISTAAGGQEYADEEIEAGKHLKALKKTLTATMPHCVCPVCLGTGKESSEGRVKCKTCQGRRFVGKARLKALESGQNGKDDSGSDDGDD